MISGWLRTRKTVTAPVFFIRNFSRILYPKLVPQGTLTWEQMVEEIASHSSFDRGVLVGAMAEIERCALSHLSHGERVQIGGICYAEATLEAEREVESESAVHAQSIRFGKVRLQPMKNFRPHGQLERAEHHRKFRESSDEPFAWGAGANRGNLLCRGYSGGGA